MKTGTGNGAAAFDSHAAIGELVAVKSNGHPKFYELLQQMAKTHNDKNHDYASDDDPLSNLKRAEKIGLEPWIGALVRMQDKMDRIEEFAKKKTLLVKDESVKDTLIDLAVYSLLCWILVDEALKVGS